MGALVELPVLRVAPDAKIPLTLVLGNGDKNLRWLV